MQDPGESKDRGDPTERTREDLRREILSLYELLVTKIDARGEVNEEKIKAATAIQREHNFAVESQLKFLEAQRLEQKSDTRSAVEAALDAAKEAVSITALNTKEQISSLNESFSTTMNALSEKLEDVRAIVTASTAAQLGGKEARQGMSDVVKLGIAIVGAIILLIGFFASRGGVG